MRTRLFTTALCLGTIFLLAACVPQFPNLDVKGLATDMRQTGIVVFSLTRPSIDGPTFGHFGFDFRRRGDKQPVFDLGTSEGLYFSGPRVDEDWDDKVIGKLFVLALEPGEYEIYRYRIKDAFGGDLTFSKGFSIPFRAEVGKITYKGNVHLMSGIVILGNTWPRDSAALVTKFARINVKTITQDVFQPQSTFGGAQLETDVMNMIGIVRVKTDACKKGILRGRENKNGPYIWSARNGVVYQGTNEEIWAVDFCGLVEDFDLNLEADGRGGTRFKVVQRK